MSVESRRSRVGHFHSRSLVRSAGHAGPRWSAVRGAGAVRWWDTHTALDTAPLTGAFRRPRAAARAGAPGPTGTGAGTGTGTGTDTGPGTGRWWSRSLARDSSRLSSSRLASFASHTGTLISVMMPATPRIACVRLCAMHRLRYARRGFAIGRLAALAFARVWDRLSSRKASRVVAPELGEGVSGGLRSGGAEEAQVELRATREVVDAVARAPRVTVAIVGHQRVPDDALRVPVARRTVGMEPVSLHAHAVWVMWST